MDLYIRERGDHRKALTLLEEVSPRQLPATTAQEVWRLRGECLKQLGELPAAVEAYQQAMTSELAALESSDPPERAAGISFFHLGRAQLLSREFARAEATARRGLERFPERWQLQDILAVALHKQGRTAEALEVYRQAASHLQGMYPPQAARVSSIYGSMLAYIQHGSPAGGVVEEPTSSGAHPDGGWAVERVPELDSPFRNIERRHRLSPEEFIAEYALANRPVLLSGILEDWPAWRNWTKSALLQRHGDTWVQVRKSSDVTDDNYQEGRQRPRMRLREYVEQVMGKGASGERDPLYLFGLQVLEGMEGDYRHPPHFAGPMFAFDEEQRHSRALFYVGPAYSGVSFHQHTAAWNALLFGYKRWFLLPPFHFHGPTTIAMHEWARAHREPFAAELHECVQGPGEVLFVPQHWYHAVLNVSDCVGIAVELGPNSRLLQHQLDSAASG
ncbi:cupin-like domain-containing protein [Archangium violaceum]|uniref:cupin-like domain-containing protein n=1 Tax=Archangium violaceum TaxID=83451 RepID=UPI001951D8E7|nr:cupin-like domain-containing protein [Archangium violaceum]QRO01546.1 cupin-like domain-containing protein [Archangium violaceum]